MIIIKDEDVISQSGVMGMKWGVRRDAFLERERGLRNKAQNVVDVSKKQFETTGSRKGINISDLNAAAYMTKTFSQKVMPQVLFETVWQVMSRAMTGKIGNTLSSPKEIAKLAGNILARSALQLGMKEAQARPSLNRYTQKGTKDLSKKQYKFITPEAFRVAAIRIGISLAPLAAFMMGTTVRKAAEKGRENRERVEKWGDHLLGTKTSDMHTIFSDPEGYMSVLAKTPKD